MGGFCCSTLMKVFAILLCLLIALAIAADDVGNTNVKCGAAPTGCSAFTTLELDDWTEVTVNSTTTKCFSASYDTDDSDESYFVLAVRPGGDAVNPTAPTVSSGIQINELVPSWVNSALKSNPAKKTMISI